MTTNGDFALITLSRYAGEVAIRPPPAPDGFVAAPIDEGVRTSPPSNPIGQALLLHYVNAKQEVSRRRVTVRKITQGGGAFYLNAYCHERKAPRNFRVDRIVELIDVATGEVLTGAEAEELLQRLPFQPERSNHEPTRELLRDERSALQVLVFLARADGHLHPDEMLALLRYLDFASAVAAWRPEDAEVTIKGLYPDSGTFVAAAARIRRTPERCQRVIRHARGVIDADQILHPAEQDVAMNLLRLLEA